MPKLFKKDKPQDDNLWQQFKGRKNTDDLLVEKAKLLAPLVVHLIAEDIKRLFQELKEEENRKIDDKFGEVFFEIAIFYLHFIDRIAFQYLEAKQRNIFADAFYSEVIELLSRIQESEIDAAGFHLTFGAALNKRQEEYGQYEKLFAKKDEGTAGTLFWEFGKKIAGVLGSETDLITIMYTQTLLYSLMSLQLPGLFKE